MAPNVVHPFPTWKITDTGRLSRGPQATDSHKRPHYLKVKLMGFSSTSKFWDVLRPNCGPNVAVFQNKYIEEKRNVITEGRVLLARENYHSGKEKTDNQGFIA